MCIALASTQWDLDIVTDVVAGAQQVVLDHQSAQVYSCLAKGAAPTADLTPDDPKGYVPCLVVRA